jgi:hypothetical protein
MIAPDTNTGLTKDPSLARITFDRKMILADLILKLPYISKQS